MGLKLAGIDTSTFSAHSTSAALTSAARAQKLSITTIMASAGWSSENTLAKYYNKTITKPTENFRKQLLNALQKYSYFLLKTLTRNAIWWKQLFVSITVTSVIVHVYDQTVYKHNVW